MNKNHNSQLACWLFRSTHIQLRCIMQHVRIGTASLVSFPRCCRCSRTRGYPIFSRCHRQCTERADILYIFAPYTPQANLGPTPVGWHPSRSLSGRWSFTACPQWHAWHTDPGLEAPISGSKRLQCRYFWCVHHRGSPVCWREEDRDFRSGSYRWRDPVHFCRLIRPSSRALSLRTTAAWAQTLPLLSEVAYFDTDRRISILEDYRESRLPRSKRVLSEYETCTISHTAD